MLAPDLPTRNRSGNQGRKLAYPRLKLCSLGILQGPKLDQGQNQAEVPQPVKYSFAVEQKAIDLINKRRSDLAAINKRRSDDLAATKAKADNEMQEDEKEEVSTAKPPVLSVAISEPEPQQLTVEQKETVNNFCAVIGGQANESAQTLLRLLNFNVNNAITAYYDNAENLDAAIRAEQLKTGLVPSPKASLRGLANPDGNAMQDESPQLTIIYPDGSEGVAVFAADDTLWLVYQHIQESGKITPVGRAITLQNGDKSFNDNTFDTSMQDAGLFPLGTVKVT
mmetsp:Transcript_22076/g.43874  ORF Transcript_22076/g.43874 Transcript_22076/m.43874 type:complete len:281 (-) Transcript_22076:135-977(-)|eukprot:CAMPEP_0175097308 /NCGR_PEP_ID=MMETSP0086_2-20121207/5213_1 /TAXON_ID=136419 /ORGANISM="Unknown Unknown, Strain D1" /LENGTH=280 /DNA_ID=CAMNT_0016370801 /DNA_START=64 /DNA_END=906 /DNA_ORIENTATION=+